MAKDVNEDNVPIRSVRSLVAILNASGWLGWFAFLLFCTMMIGAITCEGMSILRPDLDCPAPAPSH